MPGKIIYIILVFLVLVRIIFTPKVSYQNGTKIRLTSIVYGEPIKYSSYQVVKILSYSVSLSNSPEIFYGDKITVEGQVKGDVLINAKVVSYEESKGFLYLFRKRVIRFYKSSLPEPNASLIAGVTVGAKSSIPTDFWNTLKKTGTAHVVVASGTNVSLLAGFVLGIFLLFLKRRKALIFTLIVVWIYAILSGAEAPIIRASIMASIAYMSQFWGRLYSAFRALVLTVLIMLLINPAWISDIGFILSFASTAALVLFEVKVDRLIHKVPVILRQDLSTSIAAQAGVAPILFFVFGQFNILSPIINALVLWTIPLITILGGVAGLIGIFIPFLGRLILFLIFPLTAWFVELTNFAASF